jgi:mitogen-activated protein kinase kinase kinase 1
MNLPQIDGSEPSSALPGLAMTGQAQGPNQGPVIVLPHSEPLSDALKEQAEPFLEIFGFEIMTCFLSQTWSTRQAAIQKVEE